MQAEIQAAPQLREEQQTVEDSKPVFLTENDVEEEKEEPEMEKMEQPEKEEVSKSRKVFCRCVMITVSF